MKQKIIKQGAEAILIKEKSALLKKRVAKSYRYIELDNYLRRTRTKQELKLLKKSINFIPTPKVYNIDDNYVIKMDFLDGELLKNIVSKLLVIKRKKIFEQVGKHLAKIHDNDIIHGDMTTSNMILIKDKIFFFDYGLGYISNKVEDKAVDIHLFKQAIESKHYNFFDEIMSSFLLGYSISKNSKKVLERINAVEKRGRYKRKKN